MFGRCCLGKRKRLVKALPFSLALGGALSDLVKARDADTDPLSLALKKVYVAV